MKKVSKKLMAAALVMVLSLVVLAGCSKKVSDDDPVLGTWTATEMAGMSIEEIAELTGEEMPAVTMEFKNDGSGSAAFSGEAEDFSWEKDGEAYLLDLGYDEKSPATIADGVLTLTVDGDEMKFEQK